MKFFILILVIFNLCLPSHAWLWNKKDKALENELKGKGYAGQLPDLNKIKPKEEKAATPIFESQKNFNDPTDLKPIPRDNPAFINIISKKDKNSEYVNDANEIIPILEKLANTIEEKLSLQIFITRANVLAMNLDHLAVKYDGLPESHYESFKKLMEINRYVKTVAQLRREAVVYQKYLAYQSTGSIYNPENINQQLDYLFEELNSAVILLKQEF
ncbi:hypothetical protein IKB17_02530 [bacterium]|nr:hypothetical protein [bacterium]